MRGLRNFRTFGLLPAVAWLFVQLTMSGLAPPAGATVPAQSNPNPDLLVFNLAAICTQAGISFADNDSPQMPANGGSGRSGECHWCQSFGKMPPLAVPDATIAYLSVPVTIRHDKFDDRRPGGRIDYPFFLSRAPPL